MTALIRVVGTVLSYPLALILPMAATNQFGPSNNGLQMEVGPWLPAHLSWFQTPNNNLYGDAEFQDSHKKTYWTQVLWLWQNPFAGFAK